MHQGLSQQCICTPETCVTCPKNTYSKGGINPICTLCPQETQYTAINKKLFTSVDFCAAEKGALYYVHLHLIQTLQHMHDCL